MKMKMVTKILDPRSNLGNISLITNVYWYPFRARGETFLGGKKGERVEQVAVLTLWL